MTAERVYAEPRSPEAALAELKRSAGTHFDPQVVQALLESSPHLAVPLADAA